MLSLMLRELANTTGMKYITLSGRLNFQKCHIIIYTPTMPFIWALT